MRGERAGSDHALTRSKPQVQKSIAPLLTPPTGSLEVEKYWFSASFRHSGFLSALLALSALQMAVEFPERSTSLLERFMHHRVGAIAAVHRDLQDNQRAMSDETIATVFNLLVTEENLYYHAPAALANEPMWSHLQPTPEQRKAHMAGLKHMLKLRGGVSRIGNMRGLQAFILRWVCTAVGCRIVFTLPRAYRPPSAVDDPEDEELFERSFAASHLLPHGLLVSLYNYPYASTAVKTPFPMVQSCAKAGLHPGLLHHILTFECLNADMLGWMMRRDAYAWDALDMQNLFSISMGELVRWYLVNEEALSTVDNVTAICLFIFAFIIGLGAHTACSPVPGILPRLHRQFLDKGLRPRLREAGVDGWVAVLLVIASAQNAESGDYFFQNMMETLAARPKPIRTFDDFHTLVDGCIWSPAMEPHLLKVWVYISGEWTRVREAMEADPAAIEAARRPVEKELYNHTSIPMASPYSTAHMKSCFVGRDAKYMFDKFGHHTAFGKA